jgi:hypothetical protein
MPERSLFDLLDEEDARSNPQQCEHRQERRSVTVWPGEVKELGYPEIGTTIGGIDRIAVPY